MPYYLIMPLAPACHDKFLNSITKHASALDSARSLFINIWHLKMVFSTQSMVCLSPPGSHGPPWESIRRFTRTYGMHSHAEHGNEKTRSMGTRKY